MHGVAVGEEELGEVRAEVEGGFVAAGAGAGFHCVLAVGGRDERPFEVKEVIGL